MKPSTNELFEKDHYYATRWPGQLRATVKEPDYGVPRRFGMRAVVVAMTFFSVLIALMSAMGLQIEAIYLGLLCLAVGVAQILLFSGKRRRLASAIAGSALTVTFCAMIVFTRDRQIPGRELMGALIYLAFMGALLGVGMGAVLRLVFAVDDYIGARFGHAPRAGNPSVPPSD